MFFYDTDFGPEDYYGSNLTMRDGFKENEMAQYQLNGAWENLDGGFVSSIEFGISHIESDFTKKTNIASYGSTASPDAWDDGLFNRTNLGDFMDSFNPDIGTDYYYQINPADALAAFMAINPGAVDPVDGTVCCGAGESSNKKRLVHSVNKHLLLQ